MRTSSSSSSAPLTSTSACCSSDRSRTAPAATAATPCRNWPRAPPRPQPPPPQPQPPWRGWSSSSSSSSSGSADSAGWISSIPTAARSVCCSPRASSSAGVGAGGSSGVAAAAAGSGAGTGGSLAGCRGSAAGAGGLGRAARGARGAGDSAARSCSPAAPPPLSDLLTTSDGSSKAVQLSMVSSSGASPRASSSTPANGSSSLSDPAMTLPAVALQVVCAIVCYELLRLPPLGPLCTSCRPTAAARHDAKLCMPGCRGCSSRLAPALAVLRPAPRVILADALAARRHALPVSLVVALVVLRPARLAVPRLTGAKPAHEAAWFTDFSSRGSVQRALAARLWSSAGSWNLSSNSSSRAAMLWWRCFCVWFCVCAEEQAGRPRRTSALCVVLRARRHLRCHNTSIALSGLALVCKSLSLSLADPAYPTATPRALTIAKTGAACPCHLSVSCQLVQQPECTHSPQRPFDFCRTALTRTGSQSRPALAPPPQARP
jgi:hypothetical protein